jgi:hypothetical protein
MSETGMGRYSLWNGLARPWKFPSTTRIRSQPMTFTTGEILALVAIGFVLAVIVAAYMIISRKKGWM